MPQFERRLYEPSEDVHAFGSDEDMEDEGSRLPLLIGIALIVLLSFAGVVWLAYTQGVEKGRADTPRVVASADPMSADRKPTPYSKLKIYQSPKPEQDIASEDATPPPAAMTPPDLGAPKSAIPGSKPEAKSSALKGATEPPRSDSTSAKTNAAEPAAQPATGAPRVITHVPETAKPAKAVAPPAKTPVTKPGPVPATSKPNALKTTPPVKTAAVGSTANKPATAAIAPAIVNPPHTKAAVAKTAPVKTAADKPAPIVLRPPKAATKLAAVSPATQTTAAAPAATPKTGAGGYVLQIGSYKSDAEANASWTTYKGAHSSVAGYSSDVRKVELGTKGTWYRLRIGPFANLSEANAACAKLKAQGGNCFPAKQ